MKTKVLMAIALAAFLLDWPALAFAAPGGQSPVGLTIRVESGDWGAADHRDIEVLLYAVAQTLVPGTGLLPARTIVVGHTRGAPVVLYDHGPAGEYRVLLHARDAHWHLYVYEFAHEFCHIVSNYDSHTHGPARHNQWFEESLCETASLYALNSLANDWQASAPALAGGDRQLRWFYDLLMAEDHRHPAAGDFAAWLQEREAGLRLDPYQRRLNEAVATRLLPVFQKDGGKWEALRYLNLDPADDNCSLEAYLAHWYGNARADEKSFVAAVQASLGSDAHAVVTIAADSPRFR